jgi:hypothetical protein
MARMSARLGSRLAHPASMLQTAQWLYAEVAAVPVQAAAQQLSQPPLRQLLQAAAAALLPAADAHGAASAAGGGGSGAASSGVSAWLQSGL